MKPFVALLLRPPSAQTTPSCRLQNQHIKHHQAESHIQEKYFSRDPSVELLSETDVEERARRRRKTFLSIIQVLEDVWVLSPWRGDTKVGDRLKKSRKRVQFAVFWRIVWV